MNLDSATTAHAATLVGLNPSVGIIVLILGLAFLYLIKIIALNTDITKKMGTNHGEIIDTITAIRADQIISNAERKVMTARMDAFEKKQTEMEFDILALTRWSSKKGE